MGEDGLESEDNLGCTDTFLKGKQKNEKQTHSDRIDRQTDWFPIISLEAVYVLLRQVFTAWFRMTWNIQFSCFGPQ